MGVKRARLSAVAVGVALGLVCGGWMLAIGLGAWHGSFGVDMMTRWAAMYPGVSVSLMGAFVVAGWGLVKGFFSGLIFGWIYNLCLCCCTRCCTCCKSSCESCGEGSKNTM